jgi:hypothetical protein
MLMKKGIKGTIFQVPVGAEIVKHEYYFYILLLYFFQGIFTEGRLYRAHGHIGIRVYGHMSIWAYRLMAYRHIYLYENWPVHIESIYLISGLMPGIIVIFIFLHFLAGKYSLN